MPVKIEADGTMATDELLSNPPPPAPPPPAPGEQSLVGVGTVGHTDKGGNLVHAETEHVMSALKAPADYTGPWARVTYGMGATVNTGNFENMRPFVQLELPCLPGQQHAAYNEAFDWVDARITPIVLSAKQKAGQAG